MLNNLQDIKSFIEWCKINKIKSFSNGSIAFELSELSFVPELDSHIMSEKVSAAYDETLIDTAKSELDKEDDDMLFWSTNT